MRPGAAARPSMLKPPSFSGLIFAALSRPSASSSCHLQQGLAQADRRRCPPLRASHWPLGRRCRWQTGSGARDCHCRRRWPWEVIQKMRLPIAAAPSISLMSTPSFSRRSSPDGLWLVASIETEPAPLVLRGEEMIRTSRDGSRGLAHLVVFEDLRLLAGRCRRGNGHPNGKNEQSWKRIVETGICTSAKSSKQQDRQTTPRDQGMATTGVTAGARTARLKSAWPPRPASPRWRRRRSTARGRRGPCARSRSRACSPCRRGTAGSRTSPR